MKIFANFMVESGISLAILVLVYFLVFRKETFFLQNRIFLFTSAVFSLVLPLLQFHMYDSQPILLPEIIVSPDYDFLYKFSVYGQGVTRGVTEVVSSIQIIGWVYFGGVVFFLIRFLNKCIKIYLIRKYGVEHRLGEISLVITKESIAPFSFFSTIFIPEGLEKHNSYKHILLHEIEHVKQRHTYDVMMVELLIMFQWFNPFVWLLKRAISENHEYLADKAVLASGVSKGNYKLLLLNQCLGEVILIASPFNYSLIKNRIQMINKIKSNKIISLKYILGIFILAVLLVAFATENRLMAITSQIQEEKAAEENSMIAQVADEDEEEILVKAEKEPMFPGGHLALLQFLTENVIYPKEAAKKGIQGRVYLKFVVTKKGQVENIIVENSPNELLSTEAIRVVKKLPKFHPGMDKGKAVNVWYKIPMTFRLQK